VSRCIVYAMSTKTAFLSGIATHLLNSDLPVMERPKPHNTRQMNITPSASLINIDISDFHFYL